MFNFTLDLYTTTCKSMCDITTTTTNDDVEMSCCCCCRIFSLLLLKPISQQQHELHTLTAIYSDT